MCTNDAFVSPYLLRPRRSCAEVMRDAAVRTVLATGEESGLEPNRTDKEGTGSANRKHDQCREDEARR